MAIVCKEAAEEYVKQNPDFEILAPLVMNSDIILESDREIKKIGFTANKWFHRDFLIDKYGDEVELFEMNAQSLPYSYEVGRIDAVIMDITKLGILEGKVLQPSDDDYVSYVLIVKSIYKKTDEFRLFVNAFNDAVKQLNENKKYQKYINEYSNLTERRRSEWKVKLLKIDGLN